MPRFKAIFFTQSNIVKFFQALITVKDSLFSICSKIYLKARFMYKALKEKIMPCSNGCNNEVIIVGDPAHCQLTKAL